MNVQTSTGIAPVQQGRARTQAKAALAMLAVFAGWTALFIGFSGVVGDWLGLETRNGEVVYIEAWLPWIGVLLAWVWPLLVGIGLAWRAHHRGAGRLATVSGLLNAAVLAVVTVPALVDRFTTL